MFKKCTIFHFKSKFWCETQNTNLNVNVRPIYLILLDCYRREWKFHGVSETTKYNFYLLFDYHTSYAQTWQFQWDNCQLKLYPANI